MKALGGKSALMRLFFPALLLAAFRADAHPLLQNAMWLVFSPERVRVAVNVSLKEITVAQSVKAEADGGYDAEELAAAAERHREYVLKHLELRVAGRTLTGAVTTISQPPMFVSPEQTFYQYELDYPLDGARPRTISLRQEMLREFPYAAGTPWDVSYVLRMKRGDSPEVRTGLLRAGSAAEFATGWDDAASESHALVVVAAISPFIALLVFIAMRKRRAAK